MIVAIPYFHNLPLLNLMTILILTYKRPICTYMVKLLLNSHLNWPHVRPSEKRIWAINIKVYQCSCVHDTSTWLHTSTHTHIHKITYTHNIHKIINCNIIIYFVLGLSFLFQVGMVPYHKSCVWMKQFCSLKNGCLK